MGFTFPGPLAAAAIMTALASPALAGGERAGDFDYYILALSWQPNWCRLEGDARRAPECAQDTGLGFTLHGLWPQHKAGWPSYCQSAARDPSRSQSAAMADIMGSPGLAWHQWKKHGRCSGLSAQDYFDTMRRAYGSVRLPDLFMQLDRSIELPASVVEDAFLEANPGLSAGQITITCDNGLIGEARICLTRDLEPRACGADVARDCRLPDALMDPPR